MYPVTKDFLGKPAPPGYVAGLGRGATGFTTRSDIGPAREAPTGVADKLPSRSRKDNASKSSEGQGEDDGRYNDAENEAGLFSNMPYEEDDEEADKIWEEIENKMAARHKASNGSKKALEEDSNKNIGEQFGDLKRQLQGLSEDDWNSIPEVSQLAEQAARAKRRRKNMEDRRGERMYQVSDSAMIAGLGANSGYDNQISSSTGADDDRGDGTVTNFMAIGQARDDVLRLKLDQAGNDSVSGKTTIDPKGYLTSLSTLGAKNATEIGDISRARKLLKSVIDTNPKHAPGWIAAARLEEIAKKMAKARDIISKGCENCPLNEDIWLEAARLNSKNEARVILASAVRNITTSVKIWMAAAELEASDVKSQKRVLRRALEFIPTSVTLWKAAVSLEEPDDARILLSHAVELIPLSTELWLALAKLETYEKAQKVLNKARRAIPASHEIWIAAAKLEEQNEHHDRVFKIMVKAISSLAQYGNNMDNRDSWFELAFGCEQDGYHVTCQAIINASADLGFDDNETPLEKASVWCSDAEKYMASIASSGGDAGIVTARALFSKATDTMPTSMDIWRSASELEREYGTMADLEGLLKRAVQYCPQAEVLWLIAAKEKWIKQNDVDGARVILEEAFKANPNSEEIILAGVKLESETEQYDRALKLLERARQLEFPAENGGSNGLKGTERIWMKSSVLLRQLDLLDDAITVNKEGLSLFPKFYKLWLVQAQLEQQMGEYQPARQTLSKGLKQCPNSKELWIAAAELENSKHINLPTRARAILERARIYNPKVPELWLASVRLEADMHIARNLIAKALQECPKSGILWSEAILYEQRPQRKTKSADALRNCSSDDPNIIIIIARLFLSEHKLEKAQSWFERATKVDSDFGDSWAWWLRFEIGQKASAAKQSTSDLSVFDQRIKLVEDACARADPHHGQIWPRVAKDPKNARLDTKAILHKVVEELESVKQL
ncbi:U4/U6 x U5 tri-snRNP complex subunit Prp1 [Dipsacomyces acuminosporus]|nr:U4/U6 x U5 tri-snRNP complex subunit Prp1 [Dipsacomyces acuminosporus]